RLSQHYTETAFLKWGILMRKKNVNRKPSKKKAGKPAKRTTTKAAKKPATKIKQKPAAKAVKKPAPKANEKKPAEIKSKPESAAAAPLTSAEKAASKQREISVSEFFLKNRHLLGFDNPKKALLTTIKEAVDNSLDACEDARILPEVSIEIRQK